MNIPATIASELNIPLDKVKAALQLMADGATIPFISRYRKEVTGSLNEVELFSIQQRNNALNELVKRKEYVIETISSSGKLTDKLLEEIEQATTVTQLEDIYMPYKPKRHTRASIAREKGLEPLARILMSRNNSVVPETIAKRFVSKQVPSTDEALSGASDIIAEWVSENKLARTTIRKLYDRMATIKSKVIPDHKDDTTYADYHDFSCPLKKCPSHRYLALKRGEKDGILRVSIDIDKDLATERLNTIFGTNISSASRPIITAAVVDSYKRLIKPSIENEVATSTKEDSDKTAIAIFANNLRQLLMSAPLGPKRVMGIDPGFRTGCKVVCLDENGNLLHHTVVYPTPPHNDVKTASDTILSLITRYNVEAISLGNGTASRETERFLKNISSPTMPPVYIVNEAGASIYSASENARREFPEYDVTVRGAISIARRLIDPMAELVKIEPKSIGVGQYQHDVDQNALKVSLNHTVESCVNSVGVNLNTASVDLLTYISGIGPKLAQAIVEYRSTNGLFSSRAQLLDVPRLGTKAYTQSVGFLRIPHAANPLDNTGIHPERYELVEKIARDAGCDIADLIGSAETRSRIDMTKYVLDRVGLPTLTDIMDELSRPGRDPRGTIEQITFDDAVHSITDLVPGMLLPGVVNNITAFGVFVDIGIHHSGLIHISQLSNKYVTHPSSVVSLGQHITFKVIDVNLNRKRISLALVEQ